MNPNCFIYGNISNIKEKLENITKTIVSSNDE